MRGSRYSHFWYYTALSFDRKVSVVAELYGNKKWIFTLACKRMPGKLTFLAGVKACHHGDWSVSNPVFRSLFFLVQERNFQVKWQCIRTERTPERCWSHLASLAGSKPTASSEEDLLGGKLNTEFNNWNILLKVFLSNVNHSWVVYRVKVVLSVTNNRTIHWVNNLGN